jgi:hypothetical protein
MTPWHPSYSYEVPLRKKADIGRFFCISAFFVVPVAVGCTDGGVVGDTALVLLAPGRPGLSAARSGEPDESRRPVLGDPPRSVALSTVC